MHTKHFLSHFADKFILTISAIFLCTLLFGCADSSQNDGNLAQTSNDNISVANEKENTDSTAVAEHIDNAESSDPKIDDADTNAAASATDDNAATQEETTNADPVILEELQEAHDTNADVYAWLDIPDTSVSFPIVYHEGDDAYYLTHDASGADNEDGAIYTESYNRTDFSEFMTVIFGKNREDRFAPIHNYGDKDFYDSHRTITITLLDPQETLHYTVFAAYIKDAYHILANHDFSSNIVRQEYLTSIEERNSMTDIISTDVQPAIDSHLLTLLTGITDDSDHRFVIQAIQED